MSGTIVFGCTYYGGKGGVFMISSLPNSTLGLYLAAIIAGYALLVLTILLPGPLAVFSTVIMVVAVVIIVLFSIVVILKALKTLLSR